MKATQANAQTLTGSPFDGSGCNGKIAAQIQDKASDIDWHDLIHGILGSESDARTAAQVGTTLILQCSVTGGFAVQKIATC
jgi:hypothetical protein